MVQAFTCVAVPNSVLWTGAEPIYVDIDRSLNIDLLDAQKGDVKTRAILIQHTLGILADMDNVLAFAKKIISWLSKIALIVWARHAEGKK